ncbi:MAG: hypothetical protein LBL26_05480 [Peptococcaceae bacterium]|nr:hypothetical protein [Peptococcaceae bacterium]
MNLPVLGRVPPVFNVTFSQTRDLRHHSLKRRQWSILQKASRHFLFRPFFFARNAKKAVNLTFRSKITAFLCSGFILRIVGVRSPFAI